VATVIASTGYWAQSVGLAWWLVEQRQVAAVVVLAHTATAAPVLLLSYLAGIVADRYERLSVQYMAQAWTLIMAMVVSVTACVGTGSVALMLWLATAQGAGVAMRGPAWQAGIGDMLPDRQVAAGAALSSLGFNLSRVVGPLLGGVAISFAGLATSFACNAVGATILFCVLARLRARMPARAGRAISAWPSGGVRYIVRSPVLRAACMRALSIGLPASAVLALLPVVAAEAQPGDPGHYTYLLCAFGAGGVAAALGLPRIRKRYATDVQLGAATALFAIGLLALAQWPNGGLAMIAACTAGAAWLTSFSTLNATVQRSASPAYRGRAVAMYMTLAFGGMAIGGMAWGHVADAVGAAHALRLSAGLLLAGLLLSNHPYLSLSRPPHESVAER
jgi:MFS family permease